MSSEIHSSPLTCEQEEADPENPPGLTLIIEIQFE